MIASKSGNEAGSCRDILATNGRLQFIID